MEKDYFVQQCISSPTTVVFSDVIKCIDNNYQFTPTAFKNGSIDNKNNENSGSCKILAFAQLHNKPEQETLHLFGDYYRKDVLENPQGKDHLNIRNFMQHGWKGVSFASFPLK